MRIYGVCPVRKNTTAVLHTAKKSGEEIIKEALSKGKFKKVSKPVDTLSLTRTA